MKPLGAGWPAIRRRLSKASRVLLCCDVDGTLAPIRAHPSQVRLASSTRALLQRLARPPTISLVFISGRRLSDVKRLIGVPGAWYAGNHGLEWEADGARDIDPVARRFRPTLRRLATRLRTQLRGVPGAWLEDKGLTLSLHVRQATPRNSVRARRILEAEMAPYLRRRQARISSGKRVYEVRPVGARDKGSALLHLSSRHADEHPLIVYIGDDHTDEDAFRAARRLQGISIRVGKSREGTAASYQVRDIRAVATWLRRIYAERGASEVKKRLRRC